MTIAERRKYLARMPGRYGAAARPEQGRLLDEMEVMTGLHRKSLLRLLRPGGLARQPRTRQRGRVYGPPVDDALRMIWESLDYVCAERLTPGLVPTAQRLAAHGELVLSPDLEQQLGQISVASVQRRLTGRAQDTPRLPRQGPEPANRVARTIPMGRLAWDEPVPGHFEVDLVHHSGPTTQGEYPHTLQMIDVATGWSERVAVLGRSYRHMAAGFTHILERLPFPVLELHPDNGSEFLNDHLLRFWDEAAHGLTWSRSRPYQKNDNRFVEQKNDTLVRAYFGSARLDAPEQGTALNAIYRPNVGLLQPVPTGFAPEHEGGDRRAPAAAVGSGADPVRPLVRHGRAERRAAPGVGRPVHGHQPARLAAGDLRGHRPGVGARGACPRRPGGVRPPGERRGRGSLEEGGGPRAGSPRRSHATVSQERSGGRVTFSLEGTVAQRAPPVTFSFACTRTVRRNT
jgi:hypothetical protein